MGEETPRANRFHIGLFGRRNSGKSSLVNALAGQQAAVVSDVPGTTTDAVMKNMEWPGVGAAVLVDTAGFDDEGQLGTLRVERTRRVAGCVDVALMVVSGPAADAAHERAWAARFREAGIPVLYIYNKVDADGGRWAAGWSQALGGVELLAVSARTGQGREALLEAVAGIYRRTEGETDLTEGLAAEGDVVVLVMPQDLQAPKGRLILPQVQTLRSLLDKHCMAVCCTADGLGQALSRLAAPPALMIVDSQVFPLAEKLCPPQTRLTSFSILFARSKGDIRLFAHGARALLGLHAGARVLIAEACTHVPRREDIGRVKLPRLLRRRLGDGLHIDIVSGNDFPEHLSDYDLVIHCGACMFTRRHVMGRLREARACGVPVTNYGMALAALNGMLERVLADFFGDSLGGV